MTIDTTPTGLWALSPLGVWTAGQVARVKEVMASQQASLAQRRVAEDQYTSLMVFKKEVEMGLWPNWTF